MIHHPHLIHFCILYSFPKSSSFFFKQNFLTTYTYQQVFHKLSSQLNKFWFHSKIFKSGCFVDFAENVSLRGGWLYMAKYLTEIFNLDKPLPTPPLPTPYSSNCQCTPLAVICNLPHHLFPFPTHLSHFKVTTGLFLLPTQCFNCPPYIPIENFE